MTLPKDILPQVTAAELDAFSTIGGEERLIAFVNRFRELERERIIEIIRQAQKEAMSRNGGYSKEVAEAFGQEWPLVTGWKEKLIKLIKGEQK